MRIKITFKGHHCCFSLINYVINTQVGCYLSSLDAIKRLYREKKQHDMLMNQGSALDGMGWDSSQVSHPIMGWDTSKKFFVPWDEIYFKNLLFILSHGAFFNKIASHGMGLSHPTRSPVMNSITIFLKNITIVFKWH
jgi:hypothetical protein